MRNTNMVMIDGESLKFELFKRNLSMQEVSLELGMSRGYIKNSVASGKVRMFVIKYLSDKYGINPVKYMIKDEPKEEPKPQEESAGPVVSSEVVEGILEELREINHRLANIITLMN